MSADGPAYYGKYRGVVTDNCLQDGTSDPQGRIRAKVVDVYGEDKSPWALPAVPYAANGLGLYLTPPVDAFVWIEFEHGDPHYPVWSGCFWAANQLPAARPEMKVLKTPAGTVTLDDSPNAPGITIVTAKGLKITIDQNGIEINAGKKGVIQLTDNKVTVNRDGLEVT
ncbi:phage baseplate assembly protein V [Streptomyces durmitorensis]|uniref:Phage baseplate assembly protein V n=1 Tax=Streptomyces durmitorensis TaxID=319947 RepID=A0ABY4Q4N1_9ACTN|nr:phage baseplate assembly protein V [Streptomyces durmitorensis]UQT60686.1 phage baseplate assembly protein V [Streptomyces durmitorensis]